VAKGQTGSIDVHIKVNTFMHNSDMNINITNETQASI